MKRILSFALTAFALFFSQTMQAEVDYTPTFTGNKTNNDRGIKSITLQSASYSDYAANNLTLTSSETAQCYVDRSNSVTMKAAAGESVTIALNTAGSWINSYVYIDTDKNGFTAGVVNNYIPTGDLVSYSFYNNDSDSDESGWNSAGTIINGGGKPDQRSTVALPAFNVPQEQGRYHMRIKLDWCNIDPNGDNDGKFGDFVANGGHIIDVTLEVAEMQESAASHIFNTTTITNNAFAQGTTWYTLQIGANGYVIDNNNGATYIALDETKSNACSNAQLWAFVGDNTNGYKLYNKQAGTSKVLAAPTTMNGTTGSASYPILVDATAVPSGYTDLWLFQESNDIGEGDTYYYMYEKGYPSNKINNRDNILAFWNGGADGGSTVNVRFGQAEYPINKQTGNWTALNSAGTWASSWKSATTPSITLAHSGGKNNMAYYNGNDIQLFTCLSSAASNGVYSSIYNISAEEGYAIAGYRFNFVSSGANNVTVTPTGASDVTANSSTAQTVKVSGKEETTLSFTVTSNSNMYANTSDFYVTIARSSDPVEEAQEIFVTNKGGIPYRIPAIAMAKNGDLIAVADYRHSGSDIGVVNNGRIDLHARISKDNGASWGNRFSIVDGQGANSHDFMHVGFGDPCIVADRESNRVLVLSCAGNVSFQNGTRNNHQNIARFYSEDNGATWSAPVDIADAIYAMWDNSSHGPVMAMFVGSGKIHQSRYVKVNNYYRLYCAVLLKNKDATYTNFVLYSDDFGGSWSVLGGVNTAPIPSGGDEPKVEELPNGNIVISSRINGGRDFNIFTFTDKEAATGSWGTRATSNSKNNGVSAVNNSTNGEIMILPVIRNEDNKKMWLALQSVPFGSDRNNVGIYYKELASESDYNTPANFAKDWDGRHQASYMGSAYSTMCMQQDSTIAFLYEESTHGADYTIVYKNYTIDYITNGAYSVVKSGEPEGPSDATIATIAEAKELLEKNGIGYPTETPRSTLQAAIDVAEANPTASNGSKLEVAMGNYIATTEIVRPQAGKIYTFTAVYGTTECYIYNNNGTLAIATHNGDIPANGQFVCEYNADEEYKFQFRTSDNAYYLAYPTIGGKSWLDNESQTGLEAAGGKVTRFNINKILAGDNTNTQNNDLFGLVRLDGYRGYDNSKNTDSYGPIVVKHSNLTFDGANEAFYNENFTSAFRIEEAGTETAIKNIVIEKENTIYDLSGRKIEKITKAGIYIVNGKKTIVK